MTEYPLISGIKSWAEDDRPREKMMSKGRAALSDAELIAIMIGSGSRDLTAVQLAQQILASSNNRLSQLSRLTISELCKFKGIGEAKAISIVACLELGRRRREEKGEEKKKITSSKDAYEILAAALGDLDHEEFWILLLSRSNQVKEKVLISRGGISGTVVDLRLIFKEAIDKLASSIIVCHNHPSGNIKPSENDIKLTQKLKETGKIMDIPVLDHLIFTDNGYFSFADEGIL